MKDINRKIKNFYKRWNISLDEEDKFKKFKNRVLHIISENLGSKIANDTDLAKEYLYLIGEKMPSKSILDLELENGFEVESTIIYNLFLKENDFIEFIFKIQVFFWCKYLTTTQKQKLAENIKKAIKISFIPVELKKIKKEYLFYPAGAKLLDDKVVNEVLDWLEDYPDIQRHFSLSLKQYMKKDPPRNILDNLRFALEQLLKVLLGNKKPLEKQKSYLLEFLKAKGINQEIINMYNTLISQYVHYQNENVKHNEKLSEKEIEFIIYLTGIFIRFLLQIKEK